MAVPGPMRSRIILAQFISAQFISAQLSCLLTLSFNFISPFLPSVFEVFAHRFARVVSRVLFFSGGVLLFAHRFARVVSLACFLLSLWVRPASWWRALGAVMTGKNYVRFGIDGLEDTNHLYRQKVKWGTLMRK